MARDIIAIAAAKGAIVLSQVLHNGLADGSIIAARTYGDENGVNLMGDYAKLADLPYIAADVYPYTDDELASLLGILYCSDLVLCSDTLYCG